MSIFPRKPVGAEHVVYCVMEFSVFGMVNAFGAISFLLINFCWGMYLMKKILALLMLGSVSLANAASITLYENNFDSVATTYSGVSAVLGGITDTTSGGSLVGFSGNFLWNTSNGISTTLQLSGLPNHSSISVSYRFAFVDSWDSITGSPAPDYFNMTIDGSNLLKITCNNASGALCNNESETNSSAFANVFNNGWYELSRDVSVTDAHSASELNIAFFASGSGWQGGGDESWALDKVLVTAEMPTTNNDVPEPATIALLSAGLLGFGRVRRKAAKA